MRIWEPVSSFCYFPGKRWWGGWGLPSLSLCKMLQLTMNMISMKLLTYSNRKIHLKNVPVAFLQKQKFYLYKNLNFLVTP